ncbi:MAG: ATP-binding protein, partial [Fimbriimonadales bacterium]
ISVWGVVRDGYLVRGWVIAQDITELKRLQEQLAKAYRFESIGRIAGGIAHDFNNILTAIIGYTELLASRLNNPELTRYTEGILKASQRASELTRQLLAYARKQVIQKKPVHFREVLDEMDTILNRLFTSSVFLRVEVAPDLWLVHADPTQLTQVILNLATNARDAMPEGGTLTIRVSNHIQELPTESGLEPGEYVKLEVADTGIGIPDEVLSRIFEPFYTTKLQGEGTGMGLAAVEGIVKQLGGTIEVESALRHGTTFRIYFPRYIPSDSPKETVAS